MKNELDRFLGPATLCSTKPFSLARPSNKPENLWKGIILNIAEICISLHQFHARKSSCHFVHVPEMCSEILATSKWCFSGLVASSSGVMNHESLVKFTLVKLWVLRHSFYFYFYFEHLNFTWSYRYEDLLISWSYLLIISFDLILAILSLDPRSYLLIYDLILISWSYHLLMIQDTFLLLYYLHAFDMPLTHVFHWRSTCIPHMLLRNMLLPYTWHALDTHFTYVYLEDNTWTFVYNRS